MPFQWTKCDEHPSPRSGTSPDTAGALFIFFSALPLKHPESATALWIQKDFKQHYFFPHRPEDL